MTRALFLLLALTACGRTITAPEPPPAEGCTYVVVLPLANGATAILTAFYPQEHPYCASR